MRQTSAPERTRSLPNRYLELSYEDLVVRAASDFRRRSLFEEQRERLDQVGARLFYRRALARNTKFRAQGDKAVILALDNCSYGCAVFMVRSNTGSNDGPTNISIWDKREHGTYQNVV